MAWMNSVSGDSSNRVEWADITKGIGTILIIIAHTKFASDWIGDYIDTFRTTLFFFISGCFFSVQGYDKFSKFLIRKSKTILIPYLVIASVSYVYYIFRYLNSSSEYYKDLSLVKQFFGIFYSAGTTQWMDFNLPLWFFTCLFVVQMVFYFLKKTVKTTGLLIVILILFSLAGYAEGLWSPYRLPWSMDVALTAIVFYGFGHICRSSIQSLLRKPVYIKIFLACLLFIPNLIVMDPLMNLNLKLHGHYFDFYLEAASGILFCILISNMIRSKLLNYLGRNALIFTAAHIPMLNVATKILQHVGWISNYYAVEILRVVITILLTIPVVYLVDKYPFILGKGTKPPKQSRPAENGLTTA